MCWSHAASSTWQPYRVGSQARECGGPGQMIQFLHELLVAKPSRGSASGVLFNPTVVVGVTVSREGDEENVV